MKKTRKLCAVVIAVVLTFTYLVTPIYAADKMINTDDVAEILDASIKAGKAWESIGFKAEDIAEIAKMKKNEKLMATFNREEFEEFLDNEVTMSDEEIDKYLFSEDSSAIEPYVYGHNGNPPESEAEQVERIVHVINVAQKKYSGLYTTEKFNRYVFYLYMSHYIDNPNYKKSNPGFSDIYADVITKSDVLAYDAFVAQSNVSMFADNLVNMIGAIKTNVDGINTVKKNILDIKEKSDAIAKAAQDIYQASKIEYFEKAHLITVAFKKHYASKGSVNELISAIHKDLERKDIPVEYMKLCVNGILDVIVGTFTPFGFSLSVGLVVFNQYMNLYDDAKLAALHYSLSARKADRLDKILFG